ncbi:hypothetical protein [Streptomyces platensis]|uniref:hypothetical protein n=1 Tax=Streptomyces platensis TaxID=58346 RepID=UPI0037A5C97E
MQKLGDLGFPGLAVPEECGGWGGGHLSSSAAARPSGPKRLLSGAIWCSIRQRRVPDGSRSGVRDGCGGGAGQRGERGMGRGDPGRRATAGQRRRRGLRRTRLPRHHHP